MSPKVQRCGEGPTRPGEAGANYSLTTVVLCPVSVLTTVKLANRRHDLMICHSVHTKALLHCTVLFMRHEGRVCRAVSCLAAKRCEPQLKR